MMIGTAYILAGGLSRRMGEDKLFLQMGQTTLLARGIKTCRELFETVKIAGGTAEKFESFNCNVVVDFPGAKGPMAGIIAALQDCKEDSCFIVAADLCDLNGDIVRKLINGYNGQPYCGLLEPNGIQPLCGIYNKSALPHLLDKAKSGQFGLRIALSEMAYQGIGIELDIWRNINRLSDLKLIGEKNV